MELNNKRTNIIDVSTPKPLTGCKDSDFQRDNQVNPNIYGSVMMSWRLSMCRI